MKYYTIGYGVQGNDPYLLKNIDDISTNIVQPLFNGNIMAMATALPTVVPGTPPTFLLQEDVLIQAYKYDQLNRIYQANSFKMSTINAQSLNPTGTSAFFSEYNYDDNGNITSLKRKDLSGNLFDDFSYNYTNISENNKLNYVAENPGISSSLHNSDIDNTQISGNYQYDEIGNLIEDVSENIDAITWNVYGKIASIDKSGTGNSDLEFAYDPAGNRILKKVTTSTGIVTKTWYIRDAQGNIMSTYQQTEEIYSWQSAHIYGSSRIGVYNANITLVENDVPVEPETQTTLQFTRGLKHYEITNHLGNVLSVITDKKIAQVVTYSGTNYKVFDPDVVSFTDYYPFGSPMVGRGWEAGNTGKYRFSFNGKEEDNEVTVDGGTIAFEARIYEARLCRFLSTDPLESDYAYQSTYVFAHNNPIALIDFLGMGDPPKEGEKRDISDELWNSTGNDNGGGCWDEPKTVELNAAEVTAVGNNIRCSMTPGMSPNGAIIKPPSKSFMCVEMKTEGGWITSVVIENGKSYIWNETNQWYLSADGKEFNNPWYIDITNAVGNIVKPAVSMSLDWNEKGDPFYAFKMGYINSGSINVGDFFVDCIAQGAYEGWEDFKAGGHRRSELLLTMWVGTSMSMSAPSIRVIKVANRVIDPELVLKSASSSYKGSTALAHSLSKHVRNPQIWGKLTGHKITWHNQALKHFDDIMNAPGDFIPTKNTYGNWFLEKTLPDGRGLRLNMDGTFKGFID